MDFLYAELNEKAIDIKELLNEINLVEEKIKELEDNKQDKIAKVVTTEFITTPNDTLTLATYMPTTDVVPQKDLTVINLASDNVSIGVVSNGDTDNATTLELTKGKASLSNADLYIKGEKVAPYAYGIDTFTTENDVLTKMTIKAKDGTSYAVNMPSGGGNITAGNGINISEDNTISVDTDTISTKEYVDTKVSEINGSMVDKTTAQTISGVKTFTNEIKTNQIANVNDNAMVRFKETEQKNVFGGINYDCVLMGNASRPFYSSNGDNFSGQELALLSDVGQSSGLKLYLHTLEVTMAGNDSSYYVGKISIVSTSNTQITRISTFDDMFNAGEMLSINSQKLVYPKNNIIMLPLKFYYDSDLETISCCSMVISSRSTTIEDGFGFVTISSDTVTEIN